MDKGETGPHLFSQAPLQLHPAAYPSAPIPMPPALPQQLQYKAPIRASSPSALQFQQAIQYQQTPQGQQWLQRSNYNVFFPYDYANANDNPAVARRSFPPQQSGASTATTGTSGSSFTTQNMGIFRNLLLDHNAQPPAQNLETNRIRIAFSWRRLSVKWK